MTRMTHALHYAARPASDVRRPRCRAPLAALLLAIGGALTSHPCRAAEPSAEYQKLRAQIAPDEPLAAEFSPLRAAQYLDAAALDWQQTRKCAACHTLPPYLFARPSLAQVLPPPPDVRQFFEESVTLRREAEPALPRDGISAVLINLAAGLASHDRATTGILQPVTRAALERMWSAQREDGSWEWPFRDVPPIKIDEHYGVTLAVLAAGLAPDDYAQSDAARAGLEACRRYLRAHPPQSLHQRAMLLWASCYVDGVQSPAERQQTLADLLAAQRGDGGWSLAPLVDNSKSQSPPSPALKTLQAEEGYRTKFLTFVGHSGVYESSLASDGYATGFAIYVARQAGAVADDPALRRGIQWLKTHQRASGRWFTPSQGYPGQNLITNAGTAYAVMALAACGEIP